MLLPTLKSRLFGRGRNQDRRSELHKSARPVIIFAQCFALFPVCGVNTKHPHFRRTSLKMLYTLFNLSGSLLLAIMNFYRFLTTGMNFGEMVTVIFFLGTVSSILLFIKIASMWSDLNEKWLEVETEMVDYDEHVPNLGFRFKITAFVVLSLAFGEHAMFVSKLATQILSCPLNDADPLKAYFGAAFSQIFALTPYALWKALLLEVLNLMATFAWNFMDLFIMLVSSAMAERFKQLNAKVYDSGMKNGQIWRKIRQDYNRLALLCQELDRVVRHLVTLSFGNNLFFICVQLFNTLKPIGGLTETVYFLISFGFLLGRTAAVAIHAAWINDESKKMLSKLFDIPSEFYSPEITRLVYQMSTYPIAISGSNYFFVTRSFCLKTAGAVVSFEFILQQLGPFLLHTDEKTQNDVFCVA